MSWNIDLISSWMCQTERGCFHVWAVDGNIAFHSAVCCAINARLRKGPWTFPLSFQEQVCAYIVYQIFRKQNNSKFHFESKFLQWLVSGAWVTNRSTQTVLILHVSSENGYLHVRDHQHCLSCSRASMRQHMTPGGNMSHLVTVIFLAFWWIFHLCIKRVKAVSTSLAYIMIGEVRKGT